MSHKVRDTLMKVMTKLHTGVGADGGRRKQVKYLLPSDRRFRSSVGRKTFENCLTPWSNKVLSFSFFQKNHISCFFEGIPYRTKRSDGIIGFECCIDQLLDGGYKVLDI